MATSILEADSTTAPLADIAAPAHPDFELPPFPIRKFTVEEYELMGRHGILNEEAKVELLEGWIVPKMPKYRPHEVTLRRLDIAISKRLTPEFHASNQSPITTADSEPEPDLCIVRGNIDDYEDHPRCADVILVIEVADSTLNRDRRKGVLYARGGIATYWIVNIPDRCVEVYTEPISTEPARYPQLQTWAINDTATIRVSDDLTLNIPLSEFLSIE